MINVVVRNKPGLDTFVYTDAVSVPEYAPNGAVKLVVRELVVVRPVTIELRSSATELPIAAASVATALFVITTADEDAAIARIGAATAALQMDLQKHSILLLNLWLHFVPP